MNIDIVLPLEEFHALSSPNEAFLTTATVSTAFFCCCRESRAGRFWYSSPRRSYWRSLGNAKLLINRQRNVLLESSFKSLDGVSAEIQRWVLGAPEITSLESVYWEWMELE
jgi:hypothetical protein